jgi:hypothetical protein
MEMASRGRDKLGLATCRIGKGREGEGIVCFWPITRNAPGGHNPLNSLSVWFPLSPSIFIHFPFVLNFSPFLQIVQKNKFSKGQKRK